MSGGLIQLVVSGHQDVALTYKPEITFFKKVYKRHTNFSLELKEIYTDQEPDYGDVVSFILNNGDLIHRCFIHIELPKLSFNDSSITNQNYINWKNNYLSRLKSENSKWENLYNNLKNYVSIELLLYQQLLTLFMSDNITLTNIKELVIRFNNIYKTQKNKYINLIDIEIYNKINMSGYILSINLLLTYETEVPNSNYISLSTIEDTLNEQYKYMMEYLIYYHSNWKSSVKKYNKVNSNSIKSAWNQYIGHFYFTNCELEIGGQSVEQYTADQLHVYQHHHIEEEQIKNYNSMIGQDPILYELNENDKPSTILLVPLLFWFNKTAGGALPILGMRNTSVNINLTINKLKNLVYFRDWELEYNELCVLTSLVIVNNINYITYRYDIKSKNYTYYLKNINNTVLALTYPKLNTDDINFILETYGISENNEYVMYKNNWIVFKNNLYKYPNLYNKMGGYDNYIDYNYLMNLIPKPKIKLITESVFLDDVERQKFASSKLEYVIEGFQENVFDINNLQLFDGDLSIDRPNKYLKWFVQPKNFLIGITEYGKVTPYIYDYSDYYVNKIFNKQIITLNQIELLNKYIDETYYSIVTAYKSLNRDLPKGVYYYNFALHPEEIQPSGTSNFSVIKEKKFRYELNPLFLKEYFNSSLNVNNVGLQLKVLSCSYNFFVVSNGIGRLIFSIS
jgi:hypothetical protein